MSKEKREKRDNREHDKLSKTADSCIRVVAAYLGDTSQLVNTRFR